MKKLNFVTLILLSFNMTAHAQTQSSIGNDIGPGAVRFQCYETNLFGSLSRPVKSLEIQLTGKQVISLGDNFPECGISDDSDVLQNSSILLKGYTGSNSSLEINIENKCALVLPGLNVIEDLKDLKLGNEMRSTGMLGRPTPVGGRLTTPNGQINLICSESVVSTGGRASGGNQ